MQSILVIFSFLFIVTLSHTAVPNVFNFEIPQLPKNRDGKTRLSDAINNVLTGYHFSQARKQHNIGDILTNKGRLQQKLGKFIYKDCGGNAGQIKMLKLLPDPLSFPGQIEVAASLELNQTLNAPLKMKLTMVKDKVTLPCIGGTLGSCTYEDVCSMLSNVQSCPDPLTQYGISCKCPFGKNTYNLPAADFYIPDQFLPSGQYSINAKLMSDGKQALCLDIDFVIG